MGGMGGMGDMGGSNPFDIFESFFGGGLGGMGGMGGMGSRTRSRATTGEDDRCVPVPVAWEGARRCMGCTAAVCSCVSAVCQCSARASTQHALCWHASMRVQVSMCSPRTLSTSTDTPPCCRYDLQLDFLEAVFGAAKEIDVDRLASCSVSAAAAHTARAVASSDMSAHGCMHACRRTVAHAFRRALPACKCPAHPSPSSQACSGSGAKAGTSASSCPQCGGAGQVVSAVRTPLGMFQQVCVHLNVAVGVGGGNVV